MLPQEFPVVCFMKYTLGLTAYPFSSIMCFFLKNGNSSRQARARSSEPPPPALRVHEVPRAGHPQAGQHFVQHLGVNLSGFELQLPELQVTSQPGEEEKPKFLHLYNMLTAAGGQLTFTVSYDLEEEEEDTALVLQFMIILEGKDLRISRTQDKVELRPSEDYIYVLPLKEDSFTIHGTNFPVSRKEFMTVLVDLKRILIQITDSLGVDAIYRLSSVGLDSAVPYPTDGSFASAVEVCQCPPGYTGSSCESCWPRHRRVNGTIFGGICEPCQCFGHADSCDDITAECLVSAFFFVDAD
ncbi:hypothetical protein QTO34_001127 [Cnephaeus nilssonii]|uniref:Laminin IV type A domain-containing protein n=1 Tax=Cnephaeus nilssonii TaxID=3371016 RepID=A0AA40HV44_CNENI|nr:hypothetical protein QTO34_001127 [Eptesicus nilssonii]